jgi:hypothetical protein
MPNIETKIVSTGKDGLCYVKINDEPVKDKDGAVRLFTPDEALKFANQALRGKEPKEAVNNG